MDLMRHVGQGRLSEWFCNVPLGKGLRLVHLDMLVKCFELQEKTLAALPRLSPENRILIESFTSGINRLIQDRTKDPADLQVREILRLLP